VQYLIALFYSNFIRYYVIFLAIHSIPDCDLGSLSETSMKVEKKSELIGRGGFYRRPVVFNYKNMTQQQTDDCSLLYCY